MDEEIVFGFQRPNLRDGLSIFKNSDRYTVTGFREVTWKIVL